MKSFIVLLVASLLAISTQFLRAADRASHDHTIHLPGIAGARSLDRRFVHGLRDGGYEGTVEIFDWTSQDPGLAALLARKRNEKQADVFAEKIRQRMKEDPGLKIRLIGHSGGAGIATWALERLPKDVQVESVVFIAPALSQRYDLSKALSHVRGKAYVLSSVNDVIVLGAGTRLFGTIDGVKEEAAGLRGFTMPDEADKEQYAKLVAMPYTSDWMSFGNIGDHIGPMSETFAKEFISRLLQDLPPPATRPAPDVADNVEQPVPSK